jgi:dynein heavy chain 1, cytosolic
MICYMITLMYGGKIDHDGDYQILNHLVRNLFTPAAFEDNFDAVKQIQATDAQVEGASGLQLPGSSSWSEFMEWVNRLPEREPPTYLGLPANAEKLLLVGQAKELGQNLSLIMEMLDEGEQIMAEAENEPVAS